MIEVQLDALDQLAAHVERIEFRIRAEIASSSDVRLLRTVPGVGEILAPLIWLEIGDVLRFRRAENLASYAGLVPRVFSSGGHTRLGGTSHFVNQYLKWAFVEAANCAMRANAHRQSHVGTLYRRLLASADMAAPLSPSRAIWPKPAIGFSARRSATGRRARREISSRNG